MKKTLVTGNYAQNILTTLVRIVSQLIFKLLNFTSDSRSQAQTTTSLSTNSQNEIELSFIPEKISINLTSVFPVEDNSALVTMGNSARIVAGNYAQIFEETMSFSLKLSKRIERFLPTHTVYLIEQECGLRTRLRG